VRLLAFSERTIFHQVNPQAYPLFDFTPYESALVSKIVDVARHNGLDVLHVHYALPHASAAYMARQILREFGCELPFITTLHGTDITIVGRDNSYKPVVTFSINQSDVITSVSDSLRQETLQNFRITKPIEVVPNFIDLSRYPTHHESHFRRMVADDHQRVLMHVSNFRPVKRVGDVLEIFRRVREHTPVRLVFVGDGPEQPNLAREVRHAGLSSEVMFLGKQEAIEHILPMGDVFLLPSETESFGLAALEAMACGLPVVGSAAGGIPEVVRHGVDGFLAPVGDVDGMAQGVLRLLESAETLKQ
jgi:N-acetyl-alpha-D-glucosaminyl L-malate synthase BshA